MVYIVAFLLQQRKRKFGQEEMHKWFSGITVCNAKSILKLYISESYCDNSVLLSLIDANQVNDLKSAGKLNS